LQSEIKPTNEDSLLFVGFPFSNLSKTLTTEENYTEKCDALKQRLKASLSSLPQTSAIGERGGKSPSSLLRNLRSEGYYAPSISYASIVPVKTKSAGPLRVTSVKALSG